MKIDLKKFRDGVSTVVRKQISFLCCELFIPASQAVLDTVHVTNFVQSRYCRWRTDSFPFVRVVSSIFFAFRRLSSGLRIYLLEKFEQTDVASRSS